MKTVAYFYDIYGIEGTIIASIIWPFLFLLFYIIYERKVFPSLLVSFTLASFMSLFYFNDVFSSLVFYTGLGILLFGSIILYKDRNKKSFQHFILGVSCITLVGILKYYLSKKLYPNIPDKKYKGNSTLIYKSIYSYLFTIPFIVIWVAYLYKNHMIKNEL